jgi:hypothetical protein
MTRGRASLLVALAAYQTDPAARVTLLVVQKVAYLLQAGGEPLRLTFVKGRYGPYAEALNHVLQRIEGHFLTGYGDRTEQAEMQLDPDAVKAAGAWLANQPGAMENVGKVRVLIDGFESPLGLELLTTVHWAAHAGGAKTRTEAADFVASWNPRKRRIFPTQHVDAAWDRLVTAGLIEESRRSSRSAGSSPQSRSG